MTMKKKINEAQLRNIIKESVANLLNEDAWDIPYNVNEVIKMAYKLRHKIHNIYDISDYGKGAIDATYQSPKKGLDEPYGHYGADGEIEKLLYDAYYSVDRLINDLKAASAKFREELAAELAAGEKEWENEN